MTIALDKEAFIRERALALGAGTIGSIVQLTEDDPSRVPSLAELAEGLHKTTNLTTAEASEKFLDEVAKQRTGREEKVKSIKFVAEVAKVTTTTDGGIRVVLDLDEKGCVVMRVLAECQQNGVALDIEAIPRV